MPESSTVSPERENDRAALDAAIPGATESAGPATARDAGGIAGRPRSGAAAEPPLPAPPPVTPSWTVTKSEPSLSPQAAAVLQSMREQVRAQSEYRTRILSEVREKHPETITHFDVAPHPEAAAKVTLMEARLAALADPQPAPVEPVAPESIAPGAETLAAVRPELQPEVLHNMATSVYSQGGHAHEALKDVRARVRLIAPKGADRIVSQMRLAEAGSRDEAGKRALAALGERGFAQERERIRELAGTAWEARARLDRLTDRAATLLEMRRGPGVPSEARVDEHEVLREIERRRAELYRASLEERVSRVDRKVLPAAEPRMQEKRPEWPDIRSVDCLRCGTTAARLDGRSHLHPDGTPKIDADGRPERNAPRDGKLCTPCWLNGAPMSVPELELAQRQARILESPQVHFRPGNAGWNERASESMDRDGTRRGLTPLVDDRLDTPSPWIVQPSPAELGDRRLEALIEREVLREEVLEKVQWDMPLDRESAWWDLKFPGMFDGEPETRAAATPEERLRNETARLAEAQRRLLAVVGTEDPALRRVLETQAAVRLHVAQGSAVREAWERTRGIERAESRAVAREEIERRFLAPETVAHQRRLREASGLVLPKGMEPRVQAAIRARQIERILTDLDVPSLVRRLDEISRDAPAEARPAIEALRKQVEPAMADTRLQGAVESAQLAETARQDRTVFHSGVDEAVLPGERRAEVHERSIDRWLEQIDRDGALGPGDVRSARDLAREVGELNPRSERKDYTPEDGVRPWQLAARDASIAKEVAALGQSSPDRILAALQEYRADVAARGIDMGDPFGEDLRERIIEAAARQSGFTQPEIDRLWDIRSLTAAAEDPAAFHHMMREAGAWAADPERNNDPARLRDALEMRTAGGARLVFSDDDLALVARAERAAAPYTAVVDQYRTAWLEADVPAAREAERKALEAGATHPAVAEAIASHEDPTVAELAGQVAALREFERIDPMYQDAKRDIDRADTILVATGESREAARRAWGELEQTVKAQFTRPDMLMERIRGMNSEQVRGLADQLRADPLALSANHPRTQPKLRIPGVSMAGTVEGFEPKLKTVRAPGLRGLMGQTSATGTEHQARVAAVALETWAEARERGEQTRTWATTQLGLPAETPLARVNDAAMRRLADLKTKHGELVRAWEQLSPAPTAAQIERRLKSMDPATAALARERIPELTSGAPRPAAAAPRPERVLAQPVVMSR
jgi:hypothetical protein